MRELTSHERKALTSEAHKISALVQVGQNGVSDNLIAQVEQIIALRELVKVKFNEFKDERFAFSEQIAKATNSALVRVIGNVAIFYRPAKDADKRKYGIV